MSVKLKRLSEKSGAVLDGGPQEGDTEDRIVRPAILVHAGAEKKPMRFLSGDGPIDFDEKRIQNVVKIHNADVDRLAEEYGGEDKIPLGAWPPLLDSHQDDSNARCVGRLTGRLEYEVRDVPKVGKNVPCAVARPGITFLGKDAVARAKDGRIFHLSIGIDEKTDKLGECSTVIEPAAPGAMLLGKQKKQSGRQAPIRKEATMPNMKRLQAHMTRTTKLAAMKESLTTLRGGLTAASDQVKLTKRKGEVTHRLTGLMRSGKLTPAEFKKLDLVRLSAMKDEDLNTMLGMFDVREPVINPRQHGSTDAAEFASMGKDLEKRQLTRLASETRKDMKRMGKKLKGGDDDDKDEKGLAGAPGAPAARQEPGADADPAAKEKHAAYLQHMSDMGKHLAAGDVEKAKESHKAMASYHEEHGMKHMEGGAPGDVKSEDYDKSMTAMQGQVDELNTQMARMAGMVEELIGAEKEEGHAIESEKEEPAPAAAS